MVPTLPRALQIELAAEDNLAGEQLLLEEQISHIENSMKCRLGTRLPTLSKRVGQHLE